MNNDLKQFSEERLRFWIDNSSDPDIEALARIALAAKQAKPVGYLFVSPDGGIAYSISNVEFEGVKLVGPIYSTPPANSPAIPDGWIKCSDRMPEIEEDYYQTFSSAGVDISYFFEGYFTDQNITHWMPLPEAPKPESE